MAQTSAAMAQTSVAIRNLETQLSQVAANQAIRPPGTLPSNTEIPKAPGKEHVKAITLRSGKDLGEATVGPLTKTDFEKTSKDTTVPPVPYLGSAFQETTPPVSTTDDALGKKSVDGGVDNPKSSFVTPPTPVVSDPTSIKEPSCSKQSKQPVIKPVPLYVPYPQLLRN